MGVDAVNNARHRCNPTKQIYRITALKERAHCSTTGHCKRSNFHILEIAPFCVLLPGQLYQALSKNAARIVKGKDFSQPVDECVF